MRKGGIFIPISLILFCLNITYTEKVSKPSPMQSNRSGEFANLDTTKGNVSSASWYIFAKNKFNPLHISIPDKVSDINDNSGCKIYPNPVKGALTIESHWPGF